MCCLRRWPETYPVLGREGVELVLLGYNIPATSHAPAAGDELVFKGKTYVVERRCFVYEDQGAVVGVTLLVRPAEGFFPLG